MSKEERNKIILRLLRRFVDHPENIVEAEYGVKQNKLYLEGWTHYKGDKEKQAFIEWLDDEEESYER